MIEACGLSKNYGPRPAVQDVSFRAAPGEILGFLGPNGAGKTTTMRILAGCLAPSAGTAKIAGYDIFEQSLDARRSLGYLPEQVPLYPEMRVEEYLLFAAALRTADRSMVESRLETVLGRCGLLDVRAKLIGSLSRGYRQRVGLAQAMLPNPPVLILDEPTVGLDPKQIIEVRELIRDLAGDHTVLLSTHILPEVSALCSRVVIIDHGRVAAEGTPEELTRAARGGERLVVEVEGSGAAIAQRLEAVSGVAAVAVADGRGRGDRGVARLVVQSGATDERQARSVRRSVAAAVVESGAGLLEMRAERLTLEEIFVRLVTTEAA